MALSHSITPVLGFAHLTDLPCYQLVCGEASAVISPYGAHLLSYQPKNGVEVLYLSPETQWQNNTPIRGGVPVCWPWFGPAADVFNPQQQKLANHGVVRNQFWQLASQQSSETEVSLSFEIKTPSLPYAHAPAFLRLTLSLTPEHLTLKLSSSQGIQQAALHSYFAVAGVEHAVVSPLQGDFIDKVKGGQQHQTEPDLRFAEEIDRVYLATAEELTLATGQHQINIKQQQHDASVLWNPWSAKAAALKDLPDQGYLHFVCVETARLSLTNDSALELVQQLSYCPQLE